MTVLCFAFVARIYASKNIIRLTSSPLSPASITPRLNKFNIVSKQSSQPMSIIPISAPDARIVSEGYVQRRSVRSSEAPIALAM